MGCIYRIVNRQTGQCYIGQTSFSNPFYRFLEHKKEAEKGNTYPLYVAMREYGYEWFECECICQVPNLHLNALEAYYAEQYDSYVPNGYNYGECGRSLVRREMEDTKRLWMKRTAIKKQYFKKNS
jgi:group I intron endonuclease